MVLVAPGLDGGQELPADARLLGGGIDDGQDLAGQVAGEEGGQAGADAGGVEDEPRGAPVGKEGQDLLAERGVLGAEPEATVHGAVAGQARPGALHLDDGEGGGIAPRIGQLEAHLGVAFDLVLTRYIQQQGVGPAGSGFVQAAVVAPHQFLAAGGEEAAGDVDLFQVELGAHQGMLAAEALDLGLDVARRRRAPRRPPRRRRGGRRGAGRPRAPARGSGRALGQEGIAGPGGAVEDGGDVGGGAHGHKVALPLPGGDVLGLVGLQQQVGGGADDAGAGAGGEKEGAGAAQLDLVAVAAADDGAVEGVGQQLAGGA